MPPSAPFLPVTFPFKLSTLEPDGDVESCRLLDERIVEIHYFLALLLGLTMDVNITGPINFGAALLGSTGQDSRWLNANQFQLSADSILVASGAALTRLDAPPTVTLDINTAGPVPNGRDQLAVFPANTFVHVYWIYNPTTATLASIASQTAPNLGGPNLPGGYQLGAYAGALRIGAVANQFVRANIRGRWTTYFEQQVVLVTHTPGTGLPMDFSTTVPANATAFRINFVVQGAIGGAIVTAILKDGAGGTATVVTLDTNSNQISGFMAEVANYGTLLTYDLTPARAGLTFGTTCIAFENPNGG